MKIVENKTFGEERALYGSTDLIVKNCNFAGDEDGESALKECKNIRVENCSWSLRYPFWHNTGLYVANTELDEKCRAPFWYSQNIVIENSKLYGTKALRECSDVQIANTDIISAEFGWSVNGVRMTDTKASGEYFMMRSSDLLFDRVELSGKYSFQYITNSEFEDCIFDTKDAFWHAKNVVVKNSFIKGEYLAWYAENITFENCKIIGTQPFCYCKELKLINCEMIDADLSFEKSSVEATITTPVLSIKNPLSGHIVVPSVKELIIDDDNSRCSIVETDTKK